MSFISKYIVLSIVPSCHIKIYHAIMNLQRHILTFFSALVLANLNGGHLARFIQNNENKYEWACHLIENCQKSLEISIATKPFSDNLICKTIGNVIVQFWQDICWWAGCRPFLMTSCWHHFQTADFKTTNWYIYVFSLYLCHPGGPVLYLHLSRYTPNKIKFHNLILVFTVYTI